MYDHSNVIAYLKQLILKRDKINNEIKELMDILKTDTEAVKHDYFKQNSPWDKWKYEHPAYPIREVVIKSKSDCDLSDGEFQMKYSKPESN